MNDNEVFAGAAVMGAVAGLRSMSPPAIVSQLAKSGLLPVEDSPLAFLNHPATVKTMTVLAVGELVADKLPFMPKRTQTPSLVARAVSGGLAGAVICSAKKRSVLGGVLLGALGAVGAAYAGYEFRRWAGRQFNVPDAVVAVVEDAVVAASGWLVLSRLRA